MDTTPAPRPFRFPILPRRRFFLSATAAAGAIVVGTATPVARAAPSGTASLTPLPETQVVATTDGMTVEVPVVLGGTLAVSGGTLPQGTRRRSTSPRRLPVSPRTHGLSHALTRRLPPMTAPPAQCQSASMSTLLRTRTSSQSARYAPWPSPMTSSHHQRQPPSFSICRTDSTRPSKNPSTPEQRPTFCGEPRSARPGRRNAGRTATTYGTRST